MMKTIAVPQRPANPLARRLALAGIVILALAACSVVRTLYNQAGNIAYWQINRAFHLEDDQAEQVKDGINAWFKWHRHTELPVYAQLLRRAAREAQGPISPGVACERRAEFQVVGQRAADHAVPFMAQLFRSLKPYQIRQFQSFLDDLNEDFRDDFLQPDKTDRDEAAARFVIKWTEFFYGRFSDAQRDQLVKAVLNGPLSARDVYEERLRIEKEMLRIIQHAVNEHAPQADVEQALRQLMQETIAPVQEPRRTKMTRWIAAGCALASATHNTTTPEQRNHVSDKLLNWERDVIVLSQER